MPVKTLGSREEVSRRALLKVLHSRIPFWFVSKTRESFLPYPMLPPRCSLGKEEASRAGARSKLHCTCAWTAHHESGEGVPKAGWAGVSEGFGLRGCRLLRAGVLMKDILLHYPLHLLLTCVGCGPSKGGGLFLSHPTPFSLVFSQAGSG